MKQKELRLMLSLEQGQQRVVLAALDGSEGYYSQMEQYEPSKDGRAYARRNREMAERMRQRTEGAMADSGLSGNPFCQIRLNDEEADLLLVALEVMLASDSHSDHDTVQILADDVRRFVYRAGGDA